MPDGAAAALAHISQHTAMTGSTTAGTAPRENLINCPLVHPDCRIRIRAAYVKEYHRSVIHGPSPDLSGRLQAPVGAALPTTRRHFVNIQAAHLDRLAAEVPGSVHLPDTAVYTETLGRVFFRMPREGIPRVW